MSTGTRGSPKGNPGPTARTHDQQRRLSPNPETGARSGGSVRSDRSNKFWSPGANAPPAARASRQPTRFAERRRCAKGQINGRGFGRRRAPFAAGPRLRHQDVQNYPMDGGTALKISRRPGPRTGDAGSDRTRKASSSTSRRKAAMSARATLRKTERAREYQPAPDLPT